MGGWSFLFADDIHIHERNFAPLFRLVDKKNVDVVVHSDWRDLKRRYGDYQGEAAIEPYLERVARLGHDDLFGLTHNYKTTPIRLFPACRAEILTLALPTRSHWHDEPVLTDERAVFDRLWERDRELLLRNMAATMFWIDEWQRVLDAPPHPCTHAFVFSGSMIYTRVLLQVLRYTRTRVFVLESAFTGKEFYCEERYTPIANASDIRLSTVREAVSLPQDPFARIRETLKATERLFRADNKNVRQPDSADWPAFDDPQRPTLLILGQVVNDFSIIESRRGGLSTIAFYRELIRRTLQETRCNVVFKGHPWERHKVHLGRAFTRDALQSLAEELPAELQGRLAFREDDNLIELGRRSDRVALLSSQGGLELAFHCGLRPATFGDPYYSQAGFTDDYEAIDDFLADVAKQATTGTLDVDSYDALLDFLTRFLQRHLVTERASGLRQLEKKLATPSEIRVRAPRRPAAKASDKGGIEGKLGVVAARKFRKLREDPRAFFRDAKVLKALRKK